MNAAQPGAQSGRAARIGLVRQRRRCRRRGVANHERLAAYVDRRLSGRRQLFGCRRDDGRIDVGQHDVVRRSRRGPCAASCRRASPGCSPRRGIAPAEKTESTCRCRRPVAIQFAARVRRSTSTRSTRRASRLRARASHRWRAVNRSALRSASRMRSIESVERAPVTPAVPMTIASTRLRRNRRMTFSFIRWFAEPQLQPSIVSPDFPAVKNTASGIVAFAPCAG